MNTRHQLGVPDGVDLNCEKTHPDVMFPDSEENFLSGGLRNHQLTEARRVCSGCPFRAACAEGAIDRRELFGIWGGLTYRERENLRRSRYPRQKALAVVPAHVPDEADALFGLEELVS